MHRQTSLGACTRWHFHGETSFFNSGFFSSGDVLTYKRPSYGTSNECLIMIANRVRRKKCHRMLIRTKQGRPQKKIPLYNLTPPNCKAVLNRKQWVVGHTLGTDLSRGVCGEGETNADAHARVKNAHAGGEWMRNIEGSAETRLKCGAVIALHYRVETPPNPTANIRPTLGR